jgi:nitroreductase
MGTDGTTISTEQVYAAVEAGGLAPSIHNSQPWKWRYREGTLELYADLARALPIIDPDCRQMLISCGAALLNAWLSLRAAGLDVEVSDLPSDSDLATAPLAALRIEGPRPATQDELRLASALTLRHTDRRPFDPAPLSLEQVHALRQAAEAEGCWLAALTSEDARVELTVLLARADWVEHHDPEYQAELASWIRYDPEATDGIPRPAALSSAEPRVEEFPTRDFTGGLDGEATSPGEAEERARTARVERPDVLVLGTDADGPADRLRAGRALSRVLLTATARGLATSPLGQALDIEATRSLVHSLTGGTGLTQMILRVGYPDTSTPLLAPTRRRSVADVLEHPTDT